MATFTTAASGNESAGATWVGGVAPSSPTDDIVIAGHTLTWDRDVTYNTITTNNASSKMAISGSVTRVVEATNGFVYGASTNGPLVVALVSGQTLTLRGAWTTAASLNNTNNCITNSTGGNLTLETVGAVQTATLFAVGSNSILKICTTWTAGALITTGLFSYTSTSGGIVVITQSGGSWTHNSVGMNDIVSSSTSTSIAMLSQSGTAVFDISGDFVGQVNNTAFFTCGGSSGLNYIDGTIDAGPVATPSGTTYVINHSGASTTELTGSIRHTAGAKFYTLSISGGTVLWRTQTLAMPSIHDCAVVVMAGTIDVSSLAINNSGQVAFVFVGTGSIVASPGASITNQTASAGAAVTGRTGFTIVNVESPTPTLPSEADVTLGTVYGYTGAELTGTALLVDNTILASAMTTSMQGIHLHRLLAAAYDATTKPGHADGLLNKLMEDAGAGVPRYTAASLVNAGGGGGASVADIVTGIFTALLSSADFDTTDSFGKAMDDFLAAYTVARANALATLASHDPGSALASSSEVADLPTNAELATALAAADDAVLAQVALVKAKTDNLPPDPADASDIATAFGTVNTNIAAIPAAVWTVATSTLTTVGSIGKLIVDKLSQITFTTPNKVDATADVDENAIADAVYAQIQGGGITITTTGPVLTNGGPLTIVIGDDYLNETVDRRISVTLNGTGYGSLTTDTWQLRLNTRGADALEITGTAATLSADSLQVKFPVTATQSGGLIAKQGEWSVRRTPVTTTAEFDVIRGPLIASRDLSVKRT